MANHSCTAKLAQKILRRITRSLSRPDGLLLLVTGRNTPGESKL
jgi:hypothetical protein